MTLPDIKHIPPHLQIYVEPSFPADTAGILFLVQNEINLQTEIKGRKQNVT
jgi:hypothetical protein